MLGDMQMAQYYADHDLKTAEAMKLAEEEYKTRKSVYAADTLAWCYYKNGRYDEAAKMSRAALAKRTQEANFFYHAGMIQSKLGKRVEAQQLLYHALSLNPNFHITSATIASSELKHLGATPSDRNSVAVR